ncbi:MAG: imidazolonepropionase, partial [Parvularculaceae bacterium]
RRMLRAGVTTVEFKSGYGLDSRTEIKMLEAGTAAAREAGLRAQRTFLPLHALPPEYSEDRRTYVRHAAGDMLDMAHGRGLIDAVDAFCEGIGFTLDETREMFEAARAKGLPVKLHAEQLSDLGGAGLAAQFSALSADHLEYANAGDIAAMARSGTVAVLLPGAFYFLKETKKPPIDLLRAHKVRIAIASDFNPGSSPILEPRLVMNMAATLFGLTPEEALSGMTRNAAAALGLDWEIGTLTIGKKADFCVWDIGRPADLVYWIGGDGPKRVFVDGVENEDMT